MVTTPHNLAIALKAFRVSDDGITSRAVEPGPGFARIPADLFNGLEKAKYIRKPTSEEIEAATSPPAGGQASMTLIGSNIQPAEIDMGGGILVPLGVVVARAHETSLLSVEEWNALPAEELEKRIADTIEEGRAEVADDRFAEYDARKAAEVADELAREAAAADRFAEDDARKAAEVADELAREAAAADRFAEDAARKAAGLSDEAWKALTDAERDAHLAAAAKAAEPAQPATDGQVGSGAQEAGDGGEQPEAPAVADVAPETAVAEVDAEATGWLEAPEANTGIEIPPDWRNTLNGNEKRSLAAQLSKAPIKSGEDAERVIVAEFARRTPIAG